MKGSQPTQRKGTPRAQQSYYEKRKNEQKGKKRQGQFKADGDGGKPAKSLKITRCKTGEKCICFDQTPTQSLQSGTELAIVSVVETEKATGRPSQVSPNSSETMPDTTSEKRTCKQLVLEKRKGGTSTMEGLMKILPAFCRPAQHLQAPRPPAIKKKQKKGQITKAKSGSLLYRAVLSRSRLNISRWKVYKFGERGSGFKAKTDVLQDFATLRDDCLRKGILFEDPEFPATDASLFYTQKYHRHYKWKRPKEVVRDPRFFVDGFSRFDIRQGEIGDCWILAAAANLTLSKNLFLQIVPDDQDFNDKYAGIFHFRLWKYGRWIEVVVDDRLPINRGRLAFVHSSAGNEFWSALLEKAYAKIHGSYESLRGGATSEAMEDFTGGVAEMYEIKTRPSNLFQILLKGYERASLMACSITLYSGDVEKETPQGLITGHAYSITRVESVQVNPHHRFSVSSTVELLRLRNPWGNDKEWKGPWSDGSPEWRFISDAEKEELGVSFEKDGEFWMSYSDFLKHFTRIEICNLNPDSLSEEELIDGHKKKWEISVFEGKWVCGVTAGGCRNFLDTFCHNPQYRITLTEVDDGDDRCTMIVALMQKNRLQNKNIVLLTIGYTIYKLPNSRRVPKPLDRKFFKFNTSTAKSPAFINLREVTSRFRLPLGTYCIVPSTYDPKEEGEFLLRVFTEKPSFMVENEQKIGYKKGRLVDRIFQKKVKPSQYKAEVPRQSLTEETEEESEEYEEGSEEELEEEPILSPSVQEIEETNHVYQHFIDLVGEDGEIDWMVLKEILDSSMRPELQMSEFSKDMCRSMVAMLDADCSGKLSFKEFQKLWKSLQTWKRAWVFHDVDKSGAFSGYELRETLVDAGFSLNSRLLNILMHRYGNKAQEIYFEDFIMCAIKLKTMIDVFLEQVEQPEDNFASFTFEEFLERSLYC